MKKAKTPVADSPAESRPIVTLAMWPISKLKAYKGNAKKHPAAQVQDVANSIRVFGFTVPILVNKFGVIIAGHCRLEAAELAGLTEVPVLINETMTEAQQKAFRLADNRLAESGIWDEEMLGREIEALSLAVGGWDLIGPMGFSDEELSGFAARALPKVVDESPKVDKVNVAPEPPAKPACIIGDVWMLGRHRLFVGDSLQAGTLSALMGSVRCDLVFTDPPYNVGYTGYTEEKLTIQSDDMELGEFRKFLLATFMQYRAAMKKSASIYVCHGSSLQREFENAMVRAGFEVRQQIIWAKSHFAWGRSRYKFQHEPIFYAHVAGESDKWYGDQAQSTLWQYDKPAANRLHPTAKPVELVEHALLNSSRRDDLVLDLFGGSGSTLIACERTGRQCRTAELDPKYADGIIKRWQELTGREAMHLESGESFAQVAAARLAVENGNTAPVEPESAAV